MNELNLFKYSGDIYYEMQKYDNSYNKKVITEINNAWKKGSGIDEIGHIWVDSNFLPQILRTDESNAKYIVARINVAEKRELSGIIFIHGPEILKIIDSELQNSDTIKRERNLKVSRNTYNAIVDSDAAFKKRAEFKEIMSDEKKRLKKRRIMRYKVTRDELTGELLDLKNCQFSHIRSWARYPQYAVNIENGHIVNKETHNIITSNGINDEDELIVLCDELGWDTSWYQEYKDVFGDL